MLLYSTSRNLCFLTCSASSFAAALLGFSSTYFNCMDTCRSAYCPTLPLLPPGRAEPQLAPLPLLFQVVLESIVIYLPAFVFPCTLHSIFAFQSSYPLSSEANRVVIVYALKFDTFRIYNKKFLFVIIIL